MRPLVPVLAVSLVAVLGCGAFVEGFEQGSTESVVENYAQVCAAVDGAEASPNQRQLAARCQQATRAAAAGELGMLEASVFAGLLSAAAEDGRITDEELEMVEDDWEKIHPGG